MGADRIKIGFIGCGRAAQTVHLPYLAASEQCQIKTLVDKRIVLASELAARGRRVAVHDPAAMDATRHALAEHRDRIVFCEDSEACIEQSDVVVVTTPAQEYRDIPPASFARTGPARVVIDCWRLYRDELPVEGTTYLPLGVNIPESQVGEGRRKGDGE